MTTSEMTPADIAACTCGGHNSGMGWGGDWSAWIIIFVLFAAFNNGNGGLFGGGNNANNGYALATDFATLERKLDGVNAGLCDGFYAINTGLLNGFSGVQQTLCQGFAGVNTALVQQGFETRLGTQNLASQLANCCCDIREGISGVNYNLASQANMLSRGIENGFSTTNYNMATQNCQTLTAIDKVGDRIIDYLASEKAQSLRDENFALKLAASQAQQNNYLIHQLRPIPEPAYIVPNPNCCYSSCGSCGC